jgi:hypothetical protein
VSEWGRAQDALCNVLDGYEMSQAGDWHDGLLRGKLEFKEISALIEPILEAVAPIFKHRQKELQVERDRLVAEHDELVKSVEVREELLHKVEAERDLAIEERTAWRTNAEKTRGLLRDTLAERDRLLAENEELRSGIREAALAIGEALTTEEQA